MPDDPVVATEPPPTCEAERQRARWRTFQEELHSDAVALASTRQEWARFFALGGTVRDDILTRQIAREHGLLPSLRQEAWVTWAWGAAPLLSVSAAFREQTTYSFAELKEQIDQIRLDVPRTCPQHPLFSTHSANMRAAATTGRGDCESSGARALEQVLVAFVLRNPELGYLQSMNFVAAFLLVVFGVAEQGLDRALSLMTTLIKTFETYFSDFSGLLHDTEILKLLLAREDPELSRHLARADIDFDLQTVTPSWYLTLFFNVLPPTVTARIWDLIILERPDRARGLVTRIALTMLRVIRGELLAADDLGEVYVVLRGLDQRFEDQQLAERLFGAVQEATVLNDAQLAQVWKDRNLVTPSRKRKSLERASSSKRGRIATPASATRAAFSPLRRWLSSSALGTPHAAASGPARAQAQGHGHGHGHPHGQSPEIHSPCANSSASSSSSTSVTTPLLGGHAPGTTLVVCNEGKLEQCILSPASAKLCAA